MIQRIGGKVQVKLVTQGVLSRMEKDSDLNEFIANADKANLATQMAVFLELALGGEGVY